MEVSGTVQPAHTNGQQTLPRGTPRRALTLIAMLLKVKGASSSVKVGTKVKNIRLVDSSDGHNIASKIDGFGAMNLKSEFVKKA